MLVLLETGAEAETLVSAAGPRTRDHKGRGDAMCAKLLQLCSCDPMDCSP